MYFNAFQNVGIGPEKILIPLCETESSIFYYLNSTLYSSHQFSASRIRKRCQNTVIIFICVYCQIPKEVILFLKVGLNETIHNTHSLDFPFNLLTSFVDNSCNLLFIFHLCSNILILFFL